MGNAQMQEQLQFNTPIYNSWKDAFTALNQYIDNYNAEIDQAKQRGAKLGPMDKKIKSNVRSTAKEMLRIYMKQLSELNRVEPLKVQDLPGLRTFTPSLAKLQGCTEKTIQNHRKLLVFSGVIAAEENCGANGLRVWFNPVVALKPHVNKLFPATDQAENSAPKPASQSGETKNLRPLVQDQQDHPQGIEHNTSKVDKLKGVAPQRVCEPGASHIHGVASQVDGEPEASPQDPYKTKDQDEAVQGQIQTPGPEKKPESEKKSVARGGGENQNEEMAFCLETVRRFWEYAHHVLYRGQHFSANVEREILNHIWRTVFHKFKVFPDRNSVLAYERECCQRIDMAHNWLLSHPSYSLQPPYVYFSGRDIRGTFASTAIWIREQWRNKELNRIKREAFQYRKGQVDLKEGRPVPAKNFLHKTPHELFRIHQQRLQRYGDQELLDSFLRLATDIKFYTEKIPQKPAKIRRKYKKPGGKRIGQPTQVKGLIKSQIEQ